MDNKGWVYDNALVFSVLCRGGMKDRASDKLEQCVCRNLFKEAAVGVAILGSDACLIKVNPSFARYLGYTERELVGTNMHDITHPGDRAACAKLIYSLFASGSRMHCFEKRFLHKSGRILWGAVSASRVNHGRKGRKLALVEVMDITPRKKIEESLRVSETKGQMLVEKTMRQSHANLERKVRERTVRLRKLAGELAQAEQKERRRIAHIIHEDLQQRLVAMKYQAQDLGNSVRKGRAMMPVARLLKELDEAIHITRTLSADLCPPVLYALGLGAALEWLAADLRARLGLVISTEVSERAVLPTDDLSVFAFEAVRGLLLNVAKHAGVQTVSIRVEPEGASRVRITVLDKGVGFDPQKKIQEQQKFGLFSIQERAESFGGRFEVISRPGRGTRAVLLLPCR